MTEKQITDDTLLKIPVIYFVGSFPSVSNGRKSPWLITASGDGQSGCQPQRTGANAGWEWKAAVVKAIKF